MTALEDSILPALLRPPCLISFSGGMDSSFLLAVATILARREGLPEPIPVTWRFVDAPRAMESQWQDRVIAALQVADWQVLQAGDDLDLIGPVARRLLLGYGVLLPSNMHLHLPILDLASGGSLLTGWGGDQVLQGRRPARRTTPLRALVPSAIVASVKHYRHDPFPWLHANYSRALISGRRRSRQAEPTLLAERITWQTRRRQLHLANAGLAAIAAASDVHLTHPLLDPVFTAALGRRTAGLRSLGREELLRDISGTGLPPVATAARPKAHFLEVFLRGQTREFVSNWDGSGADEGIVDRCALQSVWQQWPIPGGTAGLVQQLWLRSATRSTEFTSN